MKRMGMVIGIRPERIAEYKTHACGGLAGGARQDLRLQHAATTRSSCASRRTSCSAISSITARIGRPTAAKMAADPKTQEWWAIHEPMQAPLATRKEGDWWAMAEEVFHHD